MKKSRKARFLYLHPEVNSGKLEALEKLQVEYADYVKSCVELMLSLHRFSVPLDEKRKFFPASEVLSSQIVKNAQDHAISMVSDWAASKYTVKLKSVIRFDFKHGNFTEAERHGLSIIGKCQVDGPSGKVTQALLDLYWDWLLNEELVGRTPAVSPRIGMRLSSMTATLAASEETKLVAWWIGFSHLDAGKPRIQLPLVSSPYVKEVSDVSKGILARKTKTGRWRFEVVDKKEWEVPKASKDLPKVAVDVGLNVMAATSDGGLLGEIKPRFTKLYEKIKSVRANRQRQDLKENSKRLDSLESRLSGFLKTMAGEVTNKLVKTYPAHVFVIEDLDLSGCKGQKRFTYKAVHHALEAKAPTLKVNPAYSSQLCPSCGYTSRKNRDGIKFHCRSCGRISHADVVGALNLLGRSADKQIEGIEDYVHVGTVLKERYLLRRRNSFSSGRTALKTALVPSSQKLTTKTPRKRGIGTASNQVVL